MPDRPPHPDIANDGRYPTADEKAALRAFADSVPKRLKAVAAVEQAEDEVLAEAARALGRRHPEWADGAAWPAGLAAERGAVRAACHAVLLDDPAVFAEKGLDWCLTVRRAAGVPAAVGRDAFALIRDGFSKALMAEDFALLGPYLADAVAASEELGTKD